MTSEKVVLMVLFWITSMVYLNREANDRGRRAALVMLIYCAARLAVIL